MSRASRSLTGPLTGQRVVVTRSEEQNAEFARALEAAGAVPILCPTIGVVPLDVPTFRREVEALQPDDWLLFTSTNAVRFFFQQATAHGMDAEIVARIQVTRLQVAAVGRVTADALREHGFAVDAMPTAFTGVELAATLAQQTGGTLDGRRALLPRASIGRAEIVHALAAVGAQVTDLAIYDTVAVEPPPATRALIRNGVDIVTFTSPSTVNNFFAAIPPTHIGDAKIAVIGPTTGEAVRMWGLEVDMMPAEYTMQGLLRAISRQIQR